MMSKRTNKKLCLILVITMIMSLMPATLGFAQEPDLEKIEAFVTRIYTIALDRQPDEAGLRYWVNELATKRQTAGQAIRWILMESPEFKGRNLTDEQFIDVAYRTFLDREPEEAGKTYWLGQLEKGASQAYIIAAMIDAPTQEFQNMCRDVGIEVGRISVSEDDRPKTEPTPSPTPTPTPSPTPPTSESDDDYDDSWTHPPTVRVSAISVDEPFLLVKADENEPTDVRTIRVTVSPANASNKRVTWSSDNEEIATVDENGVVTGIKGGTATITVTSVADSSIKATVHVVVGDILVPAHFANPDVEDTLQSVIDTAPEGSVIVVAPAEFKEQLVINKPLTLLGPNAGKTGDAEDRVDEAIIKGVANGLSQLLELDAENVEINGFTFDNIRIDNYNNTTGTNTNLIGGITIANNKFINTSGTAIYLRDGRNAPGEYSADVKVLNNKIEEIKSAGSVDYNAGSGIIVMGAEDLIVHGNIISNAAYNGIQLARNNKATITDNIVTDSVQPALQIAQWNEGEHDISGNTFSTDSTEKGAIRLYGFTENYEPKFNITSNTIEDSSYGIQIGHGDTGKSYNDISKANYILSDNSFNEISENELIIYLNQEPSDGDVAEMNSLFKDVYGEEYSSRAKTNEDPFTYVVNILKVGEGKEFTTIQAAIAAASSGDTIKLYDDIETTERLQLNGKNVAFDLNGKSLNTAKLEVNNSTVVFRDSSENGEGTLATDDSIGVINAVNSNVTIENGRFVSNYNKDGSSGYANLIQVRNSELTINGGYFENNDNVGSYNRLIYANSYSTTEKTTITINGGEFVSHRNYGYIVSGDRDTNVEVVINGGKFKTTGLHSFLTNVKGSVVVNDCTFTATGNHTVFDIPKDSTVTVKGGTFSVNENAYTNPSLAGLIFHNKDTGWTSVYGTLLVDPVNPVKVNQPTYSGFLAEGATQSAKDADGFYTISK